MSSKIRIKDIARMAGVSPGTVDRVLHNRGNVSQSSREAIEAVLEKVGYKPNIHISSISLKKQYRIIATIPSFEQGDYWWSIREGILRAVDYLENIDIDCDFLTYDQFDLYSCRKVFDQVIASSADAVIIGPTFNQETKVLSEKLDVENRPYVFVDSFVRETSPVAYFSADHFKLGYLIAKLTDYITPADGELALFQAKRTGDASANTTILRKEGFMAYYGEHALRTIHKVSYSASATLSNSEEIRKFFNEHPKVKATITLNSRGSIIARELQKLGISDMKMTCVDLTKNNAEALKSNTIDFIIAQRPEQQGFMALNALIEHLIFGIYNGGDKNMPLDIITKENFEYYSEFNSI